MSKLASLKKVEGLNFFVFLATKTEGRSIGQMMFEQYALGDNEAEVEEIEARIRRKLEEFSRNLAGLFPDNEMYQNMVLEHLDYEANHYCDSLRTLRQ